jgi:hypothetical protein
VDSSLFEKAAGIQQEVPVPPTGEAIGWRRRTITAFPTRSSANCWRDVRTIAICISEGCLRSEASANTRLPFTVPDKTDISVGRD